MLRTYFVAALMALFLACGAVQAGDQDAAVAAAMAQMANEPALTQADIDAFVKIIPNVEEAMEDPQSAIKLYQDNNIEPQRFGVISSKITIGLMLDQGITREQLESSGQVPAFMIPNEAELALIKKNEAVLMDVLEEVE